MIAELERRLVELRFIEGIEKVEHVPYPTGDQFWVRFNQPLNIAKLDEIVGKHGYRMIKFATLPSKLPRGIAELLWDGVTHIIVKKISGWSSFTSKLGFEPEGIAKLATDLHGPYQIFMATEEEGIQLLYEYLDLKYVPPGPPQPSPKPVISAKIAAPPVSKPTSQPVQQPAPAAAPVAVPQPVPQPITTPAGQTVPERTQTKKESPPKEPS